MRKLLSYFEQQPTSILLFVILCFNTLNYNITGGEYQYLCYAKQFMNPNWIPGSFSVSEFAGTRLIYQVLLGSLLYFLNFETVIILTKIVLYILLSRVIANIFKILQMSNIQSVLTIIVFVYGKESFIGNEWIFGGIEPKLFAYLFVFYSLKNYLQNNYKQAFLFAAISTLFHLMVGGWFFIFISICFIYQKRIRLYFQYVIYFIVPVFPLIIYLLVGLYKNNQLLGETEHNLNWIYVYFRLSHHLGIFHNIKSFFNDHFSGIIYSAISIVAGLFLIKKYKNQPIEKIIFLMIFILIENLFFVLIAAIDKFILNESGRLFLKYYPFRMSSLAMFFLILILVNFINEIVKNKKYYSHLLIVIFVISGYLVINKGNINIQRNLKNIYDNAAFIDVSQYINNNTPKRSNFLLYKLPPFGFENNSFMKVTERESIYVPKFIPAEDNKLNEWYNRYLDIHELEKAFVNIEKVSRKYNVDFILSKEIIVHDCLKMVYKNQEYILYSIKKGDPE